MRAKRPEVNGNRGETTHGANGIRGETTRIRFTESFKEIVVTYQVHNCGGFFFLLVCFLLFAGFFCGFLWGFCRVFWVLLFFLFLLFCVVLLFLVFFCLFLFGFCICFFFFSECITGVNCESRCDTCINRICDRFDGKCTYGCIAGFKGDRCHLSGTQMLTME